MCYSCISETRSLLKQNLASLATCCILLQLSAKRETSGEKSRQLRDAQQDARDKMEVKMLKRGAF